MLDGETTLDQSTPDVPASEEVRDSTPATETNASDEVQDLDALSPDDGEEGQTEDDYSEADEDEEYEFNGKKYRVNKELKPLLMMQQDYTRKTQEVAKTRQELEAQAAEIRQQAEATKALNDDRKRLLLLDDYLDRQSKVDWNRLWQDDPIDTPRKWAEFQHWQGQRERLNSKISEAEQQRALEEERTTATRVQEALTEAKKIPGWSSEVAKSVEAHAQTYGLELPQLNELIIKFGAPIIKMAHEAYLGRQLIQKQQAAAKTPAVAPEPVKPLAPVAARGKSPAARKSLSDMSMEEYAAARQAGRAV